MRPGQRSGRLALVAALALVAGVLPLGVGSASAEPPGSPGAEPGRYIVVLRDGADPDRAADEAAAQGAQVERVYRSALRGYVATMPPQAAANLARNPNVASVEADQVVTAFAGETPTGVDRTEYDQTFPDGSIAGSFAGGIGVAVVDTGIDHTHPDLHVVGGANCAKGGPRAQSCADGLPGDGNGHGTHVAGTIGAKADGQGVVGMAPGVDLYAVRVLGNNGSGYMSWIAAGLDWVAAHGGIQVVNMSLGCQCTSAALDTAIDGVVDVGVVVVVAAGNDNADAAAFSPANHPDVVAVGALADFDGKAGGAGAATCRSDEDETRADFSNYGSTVDIAAPGVCITSTWPGGGLNTISGTSMASPHVAGAVVQYLAAGGSAAGARTALQGEGWSVAQDDSTCGYTADGKPIGRLLLVHTPCTVADPGSGGGDTTPPTTTPPTTTPPASAIEARVTTPSGVTGYSTTGKNGRDLNVTVTIVDRAAGDAPIGGASVRITLVNLDGGQWDGSSTTSSSGQATFKVRNAPAGTYQTTVVDVASGSLGWDGQTPLNSYPHSASGTSGKGSRSAAPTELRAA